MTNCTITIQGEVIVQSCSVFMLVVILVPVLVGLIFLAVILSCIKSDRYFGAIDESKNLDIGLYIENHIDYIRTIKRWGYIEPDYPSWPQNVVLPYRPWDNENQVPIY